MKDIVKKVLITPFKLAVIPFKILFRGIIALLRAPVNFYKSLQKSIRRKIIMDFVVVYMIMAVIMTVLLPMIFVVYEINQEEKRNGLNNEYMKVMEGYYKEALTKEQMFEFFDQVAQARQDNVSIDVDGLVYKSALYENTGENTVPDNIFLFFKKGIVHTKNRESIRVSTAVGTTFHGVGIERYYNLEAYRAEIFMLMLLIAFFTTLVLYFSSLLIGSRIKTILQPLYGMTKTVESITSKNMEQRIDVERMENELKDLSLTFNDMLDRIDKDYEKQKRFVSDVSHELRTPISIISGYASMLERWGKRDEEILDESITAIMDEAKNMQFLVENLLTLVRSDNQTLEFQFSEFQINELLEEVAKETKMVNTKNHKILIGDIYEQKMYMDKAKIKQVVRIFMDNAIKYTPERGYLELRTFYKRNNYCISIRDSGIGISKEDLPHLFERFYRSDESRTRETGGHGLGLAIARVIVIGHGGTIQVKSKLGKGSEFIMQFPIV